MFCLETFILNVVFQITEKKQRNKSKQLFDVIIYGLERLGFCVEFTFYLPWNK